MPKNAEGVGALVGCMQKLDGVCLMLGKQQ